MPRLARLRAVLRTASTLAGAATIALAAPGRARAQLLIDPASGTAITEWLSDPDDGLVYRPFADAFTFYGVARDEVVLASNGYLQFGGDDSYARSADRRLAELSQSLRAPAVAPLYDDLLFDDASTLLEHVAPGHYQAYTYADVRGFAPDDGGNGGAGRSTFQVAFFTGATRIGQVDFLAGDIAFSYGALAHTIGDQTVTVGIAGEGGAYTALPGSDGGEVTALGALPGGPGAPSGAGRLVVLRPNASGGYDVRGLITVPEPSSAALVFAGLGAVGVAVRRRRIR